MLLSVPGKLVRFVRDAIAPAFCVGCNTVGGWLCTDCAEKISVVREQVCCRCGRASANGKTCEKCEKYLDLDGVIVAASYEGGPMRELVHKLKYNGLTDLATILSWILFQAVVTQEWEGWVVVPMPLHTSKFHGRGFNQTDLLAKKLARYLGVEYRPNWLRQVCATVTQTKLSQLERQANVYRAFSSSADLRGEKVLLVDDVMTTGATLEAAAQALKNAGAKAVWGVVVARG